MPKLATIVHIVYMQFRTELHIITMSIIICIYYILILNSEGLNVTISGWGKNGYDQVYQG